VSLQLPAFESYRVQMSLPGTRPWEKSVYLKPTANLVTARLAPSKSATARPLSRR
jgi:hypothetical protein